MKTIKNIQKPGGRFKKKKKISELIGECFIQFGKLEFALVEICAMTESDFWEPSKYLSKYMILRLATRRERITEFIKDQMPEYAQEWEEINGAIGRAVKMRNEIAHAISHYSHSHEAIIIRSNRSTKTQETGKITLAELQKFISSLVDINTGKKGINGSFYFALMTARVNKWNQIVLPEYRIIYKIDQKVVSDWTGNK